MLLLCFLLSIKLTTSDVANNPTPGNIIKVNNSDKLGIINNPYYSADAVFSLMITLLLAIKVCE